MINMSKPMLEITEMVGDNPFHTIDLDWESRKYLRIRMRHILKTYDENGELTVNNTYYPLEKCSEEYLNNTEFERNMY